MGDLVYIVSHRGPYAEKAAGEKFYLDPAEAEKRAQELTAECPPAAFKVYPMVLSNHEGYMDGEK
jgi:hypothetical protein